jgi:hypothetical protein
MSRERAFPSTAIDDKCGGMTKREYFAGQALIGLIANGMGSLPEATARRCYQYADAMLDPKINFDREDQNGETR